MGTQVPPAEATVFALRDGVMEAIGKLSSIDMTTLDGEKMADIYLTSRRFCDQWEEFELRLTEAGKQFFAAVEAALEGKED